MTQRSAGGESPARTIKEFFSRSERNHFWDRFEWLHLLICAGVIFFFALLLLLGSFSRVENLFYDAFLKHRAWLKTAPEIAVIEMDEQSVKAIGPLPWPLHYHAQMIHQLLEFGARAVVFDSVFKESKLPYESRATEEALKDKRRFYLPVTLEAKPEKKIWVHSLPIVLEPEGEKKMWVHSVGNIEKFSSGRGHVNLEADPDGVLRRVAPYLEYEKEGYWYLPVKVAYDLDGKTLVVPRDLKVPLDQEGRLLINWPGPWKNTFEHFSYEELIRAFQATKTGMATSQILEKVKGKICLIGITVPDAAAFFVTPVESAFPSAGVQAAVLNGFLTGSFLKPASRTANLFCLVLIGVIASLLFAIFRNVPSFIAGLSLGAVWLAIAFLLFCAGGIWFYVFHPLLLILVLFSVSAIYGQIMAGREHSRLFDLATRDGLTGVYVIRHFREILNQVVREAQSKGAPVSIILMDIDNFKSINDRYGHPAGDMVLKKTAGLIRSSLRQERPLPHVDFVARYGGEEFIVLLQKVGLDFAASKAAERVRAAIAGAVFQWKDIFIPVTISLGVATLHADEKVPDQMVHRADEALYRAKRTGKNRVCTEKDIA